MKLIFMTQVRALISLQGAIYLEQQKKSKVVWQKTEFLWSELWQGLPFKPVWQKHDTADVSWKIHFKTGPICL